MALTCVSCNRPFPPNGELASIADAARIAFDPARRRVWRICVNCNEWNLLGPEAAAAALPEIAARFSARTLAGEAPPEFAPVKVGAVELIKVGPQGSDAGSFAVLLQQEVDKRATMLRWGLVFLAGATAAMAAWGYLILGTDPWNWVTTIAIYATIAPVLLVDRRLAGDRMSTTTWTVAIVFALAGEVVIAVHLGIAHVGVNLLGMTIAGPLIFAVSYLSRTRFSLVHGHSESGKRVGISRQAMRRITLDWTDADELLLCDLPGGQIVVGKHADDLFRRIWPWFGPKSFRKSFALASTIQARAADLLRAVGGLRGLFHALDGYRRDQDGRIELVRLPVLYLVALDLALKVKGHRDDDSELRGRAIEASNIAEEAEALRLLQ